MPRATAEAYQAQKEMARRQPQKATDVLGNETALERAERLEELYGSSAADVAQYRKEAALEDFEVYRSGRGIIDEAVQGVDYIWKGIKGLLYGLLCLIIFPVAWSVFDAMGLNPVPCFLLSLIVFTIFVSRLHRKREVECGRSY